MESFIIKYDIEELRPDQLQLTIYETYLKVDDNHQIQGDESYIPCPILHPPNGTSFCIDPRVYDLK
jgi:hypothetical protein